MSNLTVENVYTRHKAKELAKKHFWKLLGMMLIVVVIVYGIMALGMALLSLVPGAVTTTELTSTSVSYNINGSGAAYILGYLAMMLVIALVGGGLGLGLTSAMLDLCRGSETVTVGRVFSRMGQCLKAVGLSLWVDLKTLLWMLPAFVVAGVGFYFVLTTGNEALTALLPLISIILLFALVIPAVYRYMMSTYVLADVPETGICACVNTSKAMMKGHKWQAFKLIVPTMLILYGVALVGILLIALLVDAVPALSVVIMIVMIVAILGLALYFSIRISLAYCLFYLKRKEEQNPAAEASADAATASTEPESTDAE